MWLRHLKLDRPNAQHHLSQRYVPIHVTRASWRQDFQTDRRVGDRLHYRTVPHRRAPLPRHQQRDLSLYEDRLRCNSFDLCWGEAKVRALWRGQTRDWYFTLLRECPFERIHRSLPDLGLHNASLGWRSPTQPLPAATLNLLQREQTFPSKRSFSKEEILLIFDSRIQIYL